MEKIVWTPQLSLGIPSLDLAHKVFLEELGQLTSMPDKAVSSRLLAVIKDMEMDFGQEEALMEKIDYPEIKIHREQHARVLSALHQVVPDVMKGDYVSFHKAFDLLPQWLVMHITTMDKALALFIEYSNHKTEPVVNT